MGNIERVLKAIANKRRLAILRHLDKNTQATVGELAGLNKISMPATSRHLSILFSVDLVESEQKSLEVYYKLSLSGRRFIHKLWHIF